MEYRDELSSLLARAKNEITEEGTYVITITDGNGCQRVSALDVPEPDTLLIFYSIIEASSETASDGQIVLDSIVGGVAPFAFEWSTSDTTSSLTHLSVGLYSVTITDANHCEWEDSFTVTFAVADKEALPPTSLTVWPNPGRERLFLSGPLLLPGYRVELWDGQGRSCFAGSVATEGALEVALANPREGLYTIVVRNAEHEIVAWRKWVCLGEWSP